MIKNLRVENITVNGRAIPNQFIIWYEEDNKYYKIFKSYSSMIIKWENDEIIEVGRDWNYSRTTGKYRNILTEMDKKEFEKMLKEEFELDEETQSYYKK